MNNVFDLLKAEHIGIGEYRIKLTDMVSRQAPKIVTMNGEPKHIMVPYLKMLEILERMVTLEKEVEKNAVA